MEIQVALNAIDAALVIGIAVPSLFLARRIKQPKLRLLTGLLSGFLLIHGLYHATFALGAAYELDLLGSASDIVVEPLGWLLFLVFAVFLLRYSD